MLEGEFSALCEVEELLNSLDGILFSSDAVLASLREEIAYRRSERYCEKQLYDTIHSF